YKAAMENAQKMQLENGLMLRVVTAPFFLGTKLEAFKGCGKNDYFASHDLEDLIAVIDGRPLGLHRRPLALWHTSKQRLQETCSRPSAARAIGHLPVDVGLARSCSGFD